VEEWAGEKTLNFDYMKLDILLLIGYTLRFPVNFKTREYC